MIDKLLKIIQTAYFPHQQRMFERRLNYYYRHFMFIWFELPKDCIEIIYQFLPNIRYRRRKPRLNFNK